MILAGTLPTSRWAQVDADLGGTLTLSQGYGDSMRGDGCGQGAGPLAYNQSHLGEGYGWGWTIHEGVGEPFEMRVWSS